MDNIDYVYIHVVYIVHAYTYVRWVARDHGWRGETTLTKISPRALRTAMPPLAIRSRSTPD